MEELTPSDNKLSTETTQEESLVDGKVLYITPETKHIDYRALLGKVVQYVNMGDILAKIKAGSQYVVQVPTEFQKALDSGDLHIMQNQKTGKMWPTLVKKAENGRQQIVTDLPINEQKFLQGNPMRDLADSYYNIQMQQQIARLTEMVEKTYRTVERIEHGQMDDRIGLLEAGKNGLLLALSMPDGDEKTMQINSSRQNLLVAHGQIGQTLKRRAEEFQPLPNTGVECFFQECLHAGYLTEKDKEVAEIQEYYDLYLYTTKLISASYAIGGDLKPAEKIFGISEQYMRSISFRKVRSINRIHNKGLNDMFYMHPNAYIVAEQKICMEDAKNYDYVAIEVSGEKLLEVIGHGSEKIQQTEPGQQ